MSLRFRIGEDKMGQPFDFGSNMMNHEEKQYLDGREGISDGRVYTFSRREDILLSFISYQRADMTGYWCRQS